MKRISDFCVSFNTHYPFSQFCSIFTQFNQFFFLKKVLRVLVASSFHPIHSDPQSAILLGSSIMVLLLLKYQEVRIMQIFDKILIKNC
jgi:hypothetical protein